jgi:Coenzyme PQQ synthesis protein D (PqqD)
MTLRPGGFGVNIMSVGLDTKLSRNDEILHASVGSEEVVMMSVPAGRYYGLNAVASRIWELLETPKTIAQVCAQISEEFEVDARTCEAEVLKFVQDLLDNGIVHKAAA